MLFLSQNLIEKMTKAVLNLNIKSLTSKKNEPRHDKTDKMTVRPAKTQISRMPSLIRIFAVRSMCS